MNLTVNVPEKLSSKYLRSICDIKHVCYFLMEIACLLLSRRKKVIFKINMLSIKPKHQLRVIDFTNKRSNNHKLYFDLQTIMSTNNTNILLTSKCIVHDTPTSTNIMVKLLTLLVTNRATYSQTRSGWHYTMRGQ